MGECAKYETDGQMRESTKWMHSKEVALRRWQLHACRRGFTVAETVVAGAATVVVATVVAGAAAAVAATVVGTVDFSKHRHTPEPTTSA